ncbi:12965_t:CDS:1 [Acaulospora colombiana]|uniref:12965_t:CDS:1 n=1 Tax=Acaulospora colombiana TaxID=27376 RepID=A0ACA9KDK3_9GLOM|nr:12965_t:CDS:1 [Acaulospora colombiana]
MTFSRSFNVRLAFLTFIFLVFIQKSFAKKNETFTQTFARENKEIVDKILYNSYFNAIATGKATNAEFEYDIIQNHYFTVLWARSLGYSLIKAPVPVPKDWGLGNVTREYLITYLSSFLDLIETYSTVLEGLAVTHNFNIYGQPFSAVFKTDAEYMVKVAKTLPFEAWIATNWATNQFYYDGISISQASLKKNGYTYEFQDYIDLSASPLVKNVTEQLRSFVDLIYKSKRADRKLATEVMIQQLKYDRAYYESVVTG